MKSTAGVCPVALRALGSNVTAQQSPTLSSYRVNLQAQCYADYT